MHLLIDAQAVQSPEARGRGIGRYVRNLIQAIDRARPNWRVELVLSSHLPSPRPDDLPARPVQRFHPPMQEPKAWSAVSACLYADWLCSRQPDAVLLTSCFDPDPRVVVPHFLGSRPQVAGLLYDLIPLLFAPHYICEPNDAAMYAWRLRRLLEMDSIMAISEASADDLRSLCPDVSERIVTIGGACDPTLAPFGDEELAHARQVLATKFSVRKEFILYVGGFDYRKNLLGAIRAFACLPPSLRVRYDLMLACKLSASERKSLEREARRWGTWDSLLLPGFVSDWELRGLYQLCRIFFFPSIYEGMGLPILEALRLGAPVVASCTSSIPEYAGQAARLVDPHAPEEAATALLAELCQPRDACRHERMAQAARFTWERTATLACEALARRPEPIQLRARRLRVAWVSPLPPAVTGVADYSADVLHALGDRFEVELIVDRDQPSTDANLMGRWPLILADETANRHDARRYDVFVFQVGNGRYHTYMLPLMRRFGGMIVLHDYYLGGLVLPAVRAGIWPASLADEVESDGQTQAGRDLRAYHISEEEALMYAPLNRRILQSAAVIGVHSEWAFQRVRNQVNVPVIRLWQGMAKPQLKERTVERVHLGLDQEAFVIVTLGMASSVKRIDSLLRAVACLPEAIRQRALVAVVGPGDTEYLSELRNLATRLGLTGALRITGRVPLEQLSQYARAADVCVQLRYPTRGESSAALLRAMAAGAACVITDHGSIAEAPNDAALRISLGETEVAELALTLQRLYEDAGLRHRVGAAGVRYVEQYHPMESLVEQYANAIESLAAHRRIGHQLWLDEIGAALADLPGGADQEHLIDCWAELRCQAGFCEPASAFR
jgi:glycosyltransferase involved in cell wall biosynthesis